MIVCSCSGVSIDAKTQLMKIMLNRVIDWHFDFGFCRFQIETLNASSSQSYSIIMSIEHIQLITVTEFTIFWLFFYANFLWLILLFLRFASPRAFRLISGLVRYSFRFNWDWSIITKCKAKTKFPRWVVWICRMAVNRKGVALSLPIRWWAISNQQMSSEDDDDAVLSSSYFELRTQIAVEK